VTGKKDVLIIGAGPAGATAAILLAHAGWQVSLVEQNVFPRQKVCGECVSAGNLPLLDELGVGQAFRRLAGSELTHVGWMHGATTVIAKMPPYPEGTARYGRALRRDVFDTLLLGRARKAGVNILQPARVCRVSGSAGEFRCDIEILGAPRTPKSLHRTATIAASMIIDAHGSWEAAPEFEAAGNAELRASQRGSDLFAFKATFSKSALRPGWLPVLAVQGGYGGLVLANDGLTTVALCIRRDALRAVRSQYRGVTAGVAVESYLRESCHGMREALQGTVREGSWLAVGPLRPGTRFGEMPPGIFRVGNAAGESHPLIGEGITMALQSSKLLVEVLRFHPDRAFSAQALHAAHHAYAKAWRKSFLPRLRLAALYAHVAMRPSLAAPVGGLLKQWPALLTIAARLAGKSRGCHQFHRLSEKPI
jgi:flavin-dependent dehydrogenase